MESFYRHTNINKETQKGYALDRYLEIVSDTAYQQNENGDMCKQLKFLTKLYQSENDQKGLKMIKDLLDNYSRVYESRGWNEDGDVVYNGLFIELDTKKHADVFDKVSALYHKKLKDAKIDKIDIESQIDHLLAE